MLPPPLELAANGVTALSIALAARNHPATWSTGIVGCLLFAGVFHGAQLHADALLQVFFVLTSAWGWWHWRGGRAVRVVPIARVRPRPLLAMAAAAALVTAGYGTLLERFTDAHAPFADSAVLAFSVVAQLLLMQRRLETWAVWLLVNSIAVPLFASRGLMLTAVLYAAYWVNAWWGGWTWWRTWRAQGGAGEPVSSPSDAPGGPTGQEAGR